ncbi:MAG: hypothetical protein LC633_02510 [Desulfobulbaceae bacterium]|nr:hypothetical protein [Desulfobulbaceae bacterium]
MYLIVSSTGMELEPIESLYAGSESFLFLNIGVGPVEAAVNLTEYLCRTGSSGIAAVINLGLAGAYPDSGPELLDICLAEQEYFGDIGIALEGRIDDLDPSFTPPIEFKLTSELLDQAGLHLKKVELRCVSNMVVDREDQEWRPGEAVELCGRAARAVMEGLQDD